MARPFDVAALLVHEPLVRGLARAVLKGDDRVEDVVQETWLVALRTPARGTLRSFLGSVARRIALRLRREDRRLARRHADAPPRPPADPAIEIAAREEARRALVSALLALEEPYRETLLLRYHEGLPPRAIARRLDVPVETVRTRVRRGLERLRRRLDDEHGGTRAAWAFALAPVAAKAAAPVAARSALAASAVALAAGVAALAIWARDGAGSPAVRSMPAEVTAATDPVGVAQNTSPPATEQGAVSGTLELPDRSSVRVRILDGERALEDASLAPGPFRIGFAGGELPLAVEFGGDGVRRRRFLLARRTVDLGSIRLAQAAMYGGRVLDGEGRGVPGVTVEAYEPSQRRLIGPPAHTDGDGRFRIDLDEVAVAALPNYNLALSRGVEHAGPYALDRSGWTGDHDIRAEWTRGLAVRLVDDATGAPLAGLACELVLNGGLPSRAETVSTDAEGLLHVPSPDWGGALLTIEHPRHGRVHHLLGMTAVLAGLTELRVGTGTIKDISIAVCRPDRTPAPGVRLEIRGGWLDPEYLAALPAEQAGKVARRGRGLAVRYDGTVDAEGRIRWRNLVPDVSRGTFRLQGWVARYREDGRDVVERAPEVVDLGNGEVIVLGDPKRERVLTVRVTEGGAGRVPELRLLGARLGDWLVPHAQAVRLDGETLVWPLLIPRDGWEEAMFFIEPRGRKRTTLTVPRSEVEEALAQDRPLALAVPLDGANGRLRVVGPDGTPAPDVAVSCALRGAYTAEARATTDREGAIVLSDLESDFPYVVYAHDPRTGRATLVDPWWPGSEPQIIILLEPQPLRFRVVYEDGAPATRAGVSIQPRDQHLGPSRKATADADGWVDCPPFVHAAHTLRIAAKREGLNEGIYQRKVTPADAASGAPVVLSRE